MTIKLYVGEIGSDLAQQARADSTSAWLINSENYTTFLNLSKINDSVCYTSLGDLPKNLTIFNKIVNYADVIVYSPPKIWSDQKEIDLDDVTSSIQGLTEFLLHINNKIKQNVTNLNLSTYSDSQYLTLSDVRKHKNTQLWITGCSISHGVGVSETEKYGYILGQKLQLPVTYLTGGSTSILWQADQILRSDIVKNDIVVWGLTSENRLSLWSDHNKLIHLTAQPTQTKIQETNFSKKIIDQLLVSKTNFYHAIQSINQVINFCNKIQAKLLIVGLLSSDNLTMHLHNTKEYIKYHNINSFDSIDLGTDNTHPGPMQHQLYANFCYSKLQDLTYI